MRSRPRLAKWGSTFFAAGWNPQNVSSNTIYCVYGCFRKWWEKVPTQFIVFMDVSENGGFSPQIIHFNGVFHYKPSILGYPYFWKHPYRSLCFVAFSNHGSHFFFMTSSSKVKGIFDTWRDVALSCDGVPVKTVKPQNIPTTNWSIQM